MDFNVDSKRPVFNMNTDLRFSLCSTATFAVFVIIKSFKPPLHQVGVRRNLPAFRYMTARHLDSDVKLPIILLEVKTLIKYAQCSL
ncbi:hypothetical protein AFL42_00730 [Oceanobacillus caeni]|uniref:Uncharacterized protein n=1 Tax=Oceanobacillus caeni TaxID=405946 RepID=A0ABR5MNV5_9BACI|nr:hypothetical protein AFL42_00730 [Oceanobacillus caeni]